MEQTVELVKGLPRKELIERIHFHHRRGEVSERALAFYLLDLEEQGECKPETSAGVWAWKHLGLKRGDKLVRLARYLGEPPSHRGCRKKPFTRRRAPPAN